MEQWFSLLPTGHLLWHTEWNEPQAQCIKIKVPENPTVCTHRCRIHQTHKSDTSLLKTTSSLLCTKNEMFRVEITEINKENNLHSSSHYLLVHSSQLPPNSMQTQQSLLRLLEVIPHWEEKAHTISCYSGERRNMNVVDSVGTGMENADAELHWDWLPLQTALHSLYKDWRKNAHVDNLWMDHLHPNPDCSTLTLSN